MALRTFEGWGTNQKLETKECALRVQVFHSLPLSPGRVEVELALGYDLVSVLNMYRRVVCDIFHQFLTVLRLDSTFFQLDGVGSSRFSKSVSKLSSFVDHHTLW